MGEYPAHTLLWADKDIIGIYPESGDQVSFQIEGTGTSCTFDGGGWALKPSSSYTAYFPFNRSYYFEDKQALPISMLGQKQVGNDNTEHLGAYDILIAKGKKPASGSLIFNPERKVAFARMKLKAPKAATWKSITLESEAKFSTKAVMNLSLETPTVTATQYSNSVMLELENVQTTTESLDIIAYMIFLPIDFTGKDLDVKLMDADGNIYASEASVVNDRTNFEANGARWIEATSFLKTVSLSEAGKLSSMLTDEEKMTLTSLRIEGTLNGDDIKCLREMLGTDVNGNVTNGVLSYLDLSNATILEGGGAYYINGDTEYATSNNSIGKFMFYLCSKLEEIIIPTNTIIIDKWAFQDCSNLTTIGNLTANVASIGSAAFMRTKLSSIIIPESVTTLESNTFSSCTDLTSITIPSTITTIGNSAFSGCTKLVDINMPNSINALGEYAFGGSGLRKVKLPSGISKIQSNTFKNCTSLQYVYIPASVEEIGSGTFSGCSNLKEILCAAINSPTVNSSTFPNASMSACTLTINSDCVDEYEQAEYWKTFHIVTADLDSTWEFIEQYY